MISSETMTVSKCEFVKNDEFSYNKNIRQVDLINPIVNEMRISTQHENDAIG